jgi:Cdc6-like AAA superfamily ATPase
VSLSEKLSALWSRLFARENDVMRRPVSLQWPQLPKTRKNVPDADSFPRFRVSTLGESSGRAESEAMAQTRIALRSVFTPAQPVTDRRMFAGRIKTLARLIEIIEDRLSHVVIFGERGIGKTSMLHILSDLAEESRYLVLQGTCGAGSRFDDMFRRLLEGIPLLYLKNVSPTGPEVESGATFANRLPAGNFDARELSDLLAQVAGVRVLILLDEYDRLENEQFRQYTAELIKNLSDRAAPVQLVIAGVSSNLHELIGYIPSIRRNVIGLPLPHLNFEETQALIALGNKAAGVTFAADAIDMIYSLSNGSPYVSRLVCHHASGIALDHNRTSVTRDDIIASLDVMVEEAEARLATSPAQRVRRLDIGEQGATLGGIARIASTPDGWFSRTDLSQADGGQAMVDMIDNRLIPAGLIESSGDAAELRYKFVDEGLPNYLWLMVARNELRAKDAKTAG